MTTLTLAALPQPLECEPRADCEIRQDTPNAVTLIARAGDDLFADPATADLVKTASLFTMPVDGDFQFQAKVAVDFRERFDSGVLVGICNDLQWFKICAELDTAGRRRVVTVVTNGRSDDSNSTYLPGGEVHLRISRTVNAFGLHASSDAKRWDLIRYFGLGTTTGFRVGIAAQSPVGVGAEVTFSDFGWNNVGLLDFRDGS